MACRWSLAAAILEGVLDLAQFYDVRPDDNRSDGAVSDVDLLELSSRGGGTLMPNPRSEAQIKARLAAINADERYHYAPATVFENAPLALIQTSLEVEAETLAWVLGIDKPKSRRGKK
ncbi:MAG TPA: hypothetical protein VFX22_01720 [Candidatus Kapabacteria bacterium]|nr:hypothetical protein [Candidatus Kapabacteria bacterium]